MNESRWPLGKGLAGLFCLLIAFSSCEKPDPTLTWPNSNLVEFSQAWQKQVLIRETERVKVQVNVGKLTFKDLGNLQRITLDDNVKVNVTEPKGEQLMTVWADEGIMVYPFEEITLNNVLVELADSIEIESDKMVWNRQLAHRQFPFLMPGIARINTAHEIIYGDSLEADPLFMNWKLRAPKGLVLDSIQ